MTKRDLNMGVYYMSMGGVRVIGLAITLPPPFLQVRGRNGRCPAYPCLQALALIELETLTNSEFLNHKDDLFGRRGITEMLCSLCCVFG